MPMQNPDMHTEIVTQLHGHEFIDEINNVICHGKSCHPSQGNNIIDRCLQHIQNMLHMYSDVGYNQLLLLYDTISQRSDNNFVISKGWRTCLLSGLSCKDCVTVAPTLFVAPAYISWIQSVWLITHMHTIHKMRKSQNLLRDSTLDEEQLRVYRLSFLCVLNELQAAFPTMLMRAKMMSCETDSRIAGTQA